MKNNKFLIFLLIVGLFTSCSKELDVKNPNQPTLQGLDNETGILAYTLGGIYYNGFKYTYYSDGVPGYFWAGAMGFQEEMGDVLGSEAANWYMNQIGCPDLVTLDDGSKAPNPQTPATQYGLLRQVNQASQQGSNPTFHEWVNMYNLNNACNTILNKVDKVSFTGNSATKIAAIKGWCYWWKGFAYSRIGSIYYAGLINNDPATASNVYVTKEALIAEASANLDKAAGIFGGLSGGGDYDVVMKTIIPDFVQKGKGAVIAPDAFIRNINTLKARNILVNTPVASMSATQWASVLSLANVGIKSSDNVLTGRTNTNNDIWNAADGTACLKAIGPSTAATGTYKVSERLIQDYKTGDNRLKNNFIQGTAWIGNGDRGNAFNTRWVVKDNGAGLKDSATGTAVIVYGSNKANIGGVEFYLAGTYEENELMKAETKIYTGDIEGGLGLIDAVRKYQGAGLAAVAGTSLTLTQAKEELRRERRTGLVFRTLSFYDARRWGITDKGSAGRTGCVVVDKAGKLNTNATINFNYLDYWDVPDNEIHLNPAGAGSAPTSNPKQ